MDDYVLMLDGLEKMPDNSKPKVRPCLSGLHSWEYPGLTFAERLGSVDIIGTSFVD